MSVRYNLRSMGLRYTNIHELFEYAFIGNI